jgi:hypothetical protein
MPSPARDLESGSSPTPSRFNSSLGRLSSPILPLPMNLMNLEGLEGLFVESVGLCHLTSLTSHREDRAPQLSHLPTMPLPNNYPDPLSVIHVSVAGREIELICFILISDITATPRAAAFLFVLFISFSSLPSEGLSNGSMSSSLSL